MSATRKITVNVTQEHIDSGVQRACEQCPITLAILQAMGLPAQDGPDDVSLGVADVYVDFYYADFKSMLPQVAIDFIECFDRNRGFVYPFSFQLVVPA